MTRFAVQYEMLSREFVAQPIMIVVGTTWDAGQLEATPGNRREVATRVFDVTQSAVFGSYALLGPVQPNLGSLVLRNTLMTVQTGGAHGCLSSSLSMTAIAAAQSFQLTHLSVGC